MCRDNSGLCPADYFGRTLVANLPEKIRVGVVKGILLHQGESNTNDKAWPSKVKGVYDIRIYVSEWNLTENRWGNDWRVGLYAGCILNAFERQADIVSATAIVESRIVTFTMPALSAGVVCVTQ